MDEIGGFSLCVLIPNTNSNQRIFEAFNETQRRAKEKYKSAKSFGNI